LWTVPYTYRQGIELPVSDYCWLCTNSGLRDCKDISVAGAANFE